MPLKQPFAVFETLAFIGVKDASGQRILHILRQQTAVNGAEPPYWKITDSEMRERADMIALALNRLPKTRFK